MERFRIGDRIRVVHRGQKEDQNCTILDILEDYGENSYWLRSDQGVLQLEIETPETVFEKVN
jgi:hypothetical protein